VVFRGEIENVAKFLAGVDVFLMSSLSEGLPMSLLEAMGAGRTVVSTAVGGIPEIVESAKCGWLCPPSDAGAMADAMQRAAQSGDRAAMAASGQRFALANCSATRMVECYENVFSELIRR
jgi:glycosyltransferase involved in cell wall biosynthesis